MTAQEGLKNLYLDKISCKKNLSLHEKAIIDFCKGIPPLESDSIKELSKESFSLDVTTPWDLVDKWRKLLMLNSLLPQFEESNSLKISQYQLTRKLSRKPFWEECQLIEAYRQLNSYLNGFSSKSLPLQQLESGASLLNSGGHWSWAEIPHCRFHAELASLWVVLGTLLEDDRYINAAVKAAKWQLNTLSHDFFPFEGLFIQEEDASLVALLTWNYLLFSSISHLPDLAYFKVAADKQLTYLQSACENQFDEFPVESLFIETLIKNDSKTVKTVQKYDLPSGILDPHTNLVGLRSSSFNVVCSHFGGRTGLGAIKTKDVSVLSYGPHHFPLADCRGFGIEGGAISTQKQVKPKLAADIKEFSLKRSVRIVSPPTENGSHDLFRNSPHSGIWADVHQSFSHDKLNLDTLFYGFNSLDSIAFSFFVKASGCYLENGISLKPNSFDRYWDKSQTVYLKGVKGELQINLLGPESELQIIPLSGGKNFWGADFLLAYSLTKERPAYSWIVS